MSSAAFLSLFAAVSAQEPLKPPALAVPEGFTAELLLAAPEIRRPSAVHALRDGSLLVAEDPSDVAGRPHGRILRLVFADDWSVAERTVFADGLHTVLGMSQVDDAVLVSDVPHLLRLTDADGDGSAEERLVLVDGLVPDVPGRPGDLHDHVAGGIRLGTDGWLYVAVGEEGIARGTGRDGSTISLRGGGVLRVRPDGTRLEVVARGLGNVRDVAIDAAGELFTYGGTEDALGRRTRVTHVVPGGEYGQPWIHRAHPGRRLPAMADVGGGSPAGGLVLSAAWPAPFAESLLFCDEGDRTLRRFAVERDGATFRVAATDELARAGSVPDFRPIDACESADGRQLYVADRGAAGPHAPQETGRLWRIRMADDPPRPAAIDLPERFPPGLERLLLSPVARVRLEGQRRALQRQSTMSGVYFGMLRGGGERLGALPPAVDALWFLALREPYSTREAYLLSVAHASVAPGLRPHALRALGDLGLLRLEDVQSIDLTDPIVRRAAWRALARSAAAQPAQPAQSPGPRGRAAAALFDALGREEDPWVRIPLESALRDLGAWSFVAGAMIDAPERIRLAHLGAVRGVADRFLVLGLRAVVRAHPDAEVRREAGGLLGEIHRRPEPWDGVRWRTQPARTVAWEETAAIGNLLAGWARPAGEEGAGTRAPALEGIRRSGDAELGRARVYAPVAPDASVADAGPERERLLETLAILAELRTDAPRFVRDALRYGGDDVRGAAIGLALAVRSDGMAEVLRALAPRSAVDARARALAPGLSPGELADLLAFLARLR